MYKTKYKYACNYLKQLVAKQGIAPIEHDYQYRIDYQTTNKNSMH
jgi:hypothetical protein